MQPLCIGASYVPCIVAETGNIATTGQVPPYSHRAYISVGITNYKQTGQIFSDSDNCCKGTRRSARLENDLWWDGRNIQPSLLTIFYPRCHILMCSVSNSCYCPDWGQVWSIWNAYLVWINLCSQGSWTLWNQGDRCLDRARLIQPPPAEWLWKLLNLWKTPATILIQAVRTRWGKAYKFLRPPKALNAWWLLSILT